MVLVVFTCHWHWGFCWGLFHGLQISCQLGRESQMNPSGQEEQIFISKNKLFWKNLIFLRLKGSHPFCHFLASCEPAKKRGNIKQVKTKINLLMESAISFFCFNSWPLSSWKHPRRFYKHWKTKYTFGGEDLLNFESSSLSKTLLFLAPGSFLSPEAYILKVGDLSLAATWTGLLELFLPPSPVFEERSWTGRHSPSSWSACSSPPPPSPSQPCFPVSPVSFFFPRHFLPLVQLHRFPLSQLLLHLPQSWGLPRATLNKSFVRATNFPC